MERRKKTHRDINDCHRLALQSIRRVMPDCYQSNNEKNNNRNNKTPIEYFRNYDNTLFKITFLFLEYFDGCAFVGVCVCVIHTMSVLY